MDEATERIVEWIKNLPEFPVIPWNTDHMSLEKRYSGSWVDVNLQYDVQKMLEMNWVWTIESMTSDDVVDAGWSIRAPFDMTLHYVYNPNPPDWWYTKEVLCAKGEEISDDDLTTLGEEMIRLKELHDRGEIKNPPQLGAVGVWSDKQITLTLENWVKEFVGRTDVSFVFDPETVGKSGFLQQAEKAVEEIKAGKVETYDLGETDGGMKIKASDQVMEFFAQDPDTAAKIMEKFKEVVDE